ncbi:MAG TPA: UDP-N-acetylglucosamine 2-epimerase (non-hydrolyzing) [Gaiellales bacterium]|nr:UDP-N-acetylglucosamine 2-epimerase (non-hydrolyzing) [Gaiellales bacterium]
MRVVSVVGNRPQFIKAAPLAHALAGVCEHALVHTGQHYDADLSDVFFAELGLPRPDQTIETGSGSHAQQTAAIMTGLEPVLEGMRPDVVLVYGDTNSTLAATLVAAKAGMRVAHVESGLRSFDRSMPEEVNRVVVDALSDLRLCPSDTAVRNLAHEGMTGGVHLVGDVMVDVARVFGPVAARRSRILHRLGLAEGGYAVLTVHRQSNTSPLAMIPLVAVLEAVDRPLVFPVHPRTRAALAGAGLLERAAAAAILTEPLGYLDFTALLLSAAVCLTDSGGVQKEAYVHRVPCLTLRDSSEWVETIELGWNRLVPLDAAAVVAAMAGIETPLEHPPLYGDGHAAERIAGIVAAAGG